MEASDADLIPCSACGQPTPRGRFCVRCGAPLDEGWEGKSRTRSQFAAASHQHVALPDLISTVFPHLPRSAHAGFRVALAAGMGAVVGLAALRLFSVALIAAALLLPLLVVVYLIDVDVYEEEPAWAFALTIIWGAITGAGFGVLALHIAPSTVDVIVHGNSRYVVRQGLVLPFAGLLVLLVGPLVLLRYRRFNDVLDGVTFGASAAAAFAGAQALAYGVHFFGAGIRPGGAVAPWIWRLLSLGLGMPILIMGAAASVCAAMWLRYRAPARDADALGPSGHPLVALPLCAALVMAGAVGETFLAPWAWFLWLTAFDALVIVMLRRAIHVGLLEESLEIPIGPALICPNCGAATARHTFCGNCGVSLQALPKTRPAASSSVGPPVTEPPA
jgi:ribosomal protein L32